MWHSVVKFYQGVGILQYIGKWWLAFHSMFERRMPKMTEFQYLPFYIDRSPLYCVINVCRTTFQI
jgi:hypothetical protein